MPLRQCQCSVRQREAIHIPRPIPAEVRGLVANRGSAYLEIIQEQQTMLCDR